MKIYTIGHSSRELGELISLLKTYGIELLVDVRSFPKSSRFPQFNRESLETALRKEGIEYIHLPELGGFRKEGYLNYLESVEFKNALDRLVELTKAKRSAIMCAEKDWRKCHRRFIAGELVKRGIDVTHILDERRIEEHPRYIFL